MPSINLELPVAGTQITAGLHATNYADLQTLLNGGLDGSNFVNASLTLGSSFALNIGGDTNLYRAAADTLKTDDTLEVALDLHLRSDSSFRGIFFGAAADVKLYRGAANVLSTDDKFTATQSIRANYGAATEMSLGQDGAGAAAAGIWFGNTADTNLYRSAANTLQTDDHLICADGIKTRAISGAVADGSFNVTPGDGTIALDTNSHRLYVKSGGVWKYAALT